MEDFRALLESTGGLAEHRRAKVEPRLVAREAAVRKITAGANTQLEGWVELVEETRELFKTLEAEGLDSTLPAQTKPAALYQDVADELYRIAHSLSTPWSVLPCMCAGSTPRPDMKMPLLDLIREANNRIRARLA
jgi:hypothetical protein